LPIPYRVSALSNACLFVVKFILLVENPCMFLSLIVFYSS
jgi:hypothetical protein